MSEMSLEKAVMSRHSVRGFLQKKYRKSYSTKYSISLDGHRRERICSPGKSM